MLTLNQLCRIMPRLSPPLAGTYLGPLNDACEEFEINTPARLSAFLAQLAHESTQLRILHEEDSGVRYEGRADLGNTRHGDGARYKGRGPIQLTGRANYHACGDVLGLDLEGDPESALRLDVMFRIAGWYWQKHGLNELADAGDFQHITRRINGGLNGEAERERFHAIAREVLGA